MKSGDKIKLKDDTKECGFLAGMEGVVVADRGDEVEVKLEANSTTRWMGREFLADRAVIRPGRG